MLQKMAKISKDLNAHVSNNLPTPERRQEHLDYSRTRISCIKSLFVLTDCV